jgi:hypothetical protein
MNSFKYQHLDSIGIEPSKILTLVYSEPDQGGTRLLYRFRFFADKKIEVRSGYNMDADCTTKRLLFKEVPQRIWDDALNWINQQLECAPAGGLLQILTCFKSLILERDR